MCAACGVLNGGADWLERAGNPDGIGTDDGVTKPVNVRIWYAW